MKKAYIICGPTASGKSAFAIYLAQKLNGTIINADGMQIYKDLRTLTASPSDAELAQAPHKLYSFLGPTENYDVARYIKDAKAEILTAFDQGTTPIITGGTGMYIGILMDGIAEVPTISSQIKAELQRLPKAKLHAELKSLDPSMAERLHPSDSQRLLRALEVVKETGKSLLHFQKAPRVKPLPDLEFEVIFLSPERDFLYDNCNARFITMMDNGGLEEIESLRKRGIEIDQPIYKALGAPQLYRYIAGDISKEYAIREAQTQTRNYAKRQVTWFKNQIQAKKVISFSNMKEYHEACSKI